MNTTLAQSYVKITIIAVSSLLLGGAMLPVMAGPLAISKAPLYSGGVVKPNVLFVVDDSLSMDFEFMLTTDATRISDYDFVNDMSNDDRREIDLFLASSDTANGRGFVLLCPGVNALAFNKNIEYKPWDGFDPSSYPNALTRPDNGSNGITNLSNAKYAEWNDDGDGVYEFGECGEFNTTTAPISLHFEAAKLLPVSALSVAQQQNYANWYTYYRKRSFAFKAALSTPISQLHFRAGLATINANADDGWGFNIEDVDWESPEATVLADREAFIDTFYKIGSDPSKMGGTPLRRALENAGLYYQIGSPDAPRKPQTNFLADLNASPMVPNGSGGECQSNHTVLITDGYQHDLGNWWWNGTLNWWNDTHHGPGSTQNTSLERNRTGSALYGNVDNDDATYGGGLHADNSGDTLADIAMYYYKEDLQTGYPDKVRVNLAKLHGDVDADEDGNLDKLPAHFYEKNTHQHMITHTISFGVTGNLSGYPYNQTSINWPEVTSEDFLDSTLDTLDDLVHAAYNGRGLYLSAKSSDELQSGFKTLMSAIQNGEDSGTAAATGFNSTSIASDTWLFRGQFKMTDWSGDLLAYDFSTGTLVAGQQAKWSAVEELESRTSSRNIYTYNGSNGVNFALPSSYPTLNISTDISQAQVDDLLTGKPGTVNEAAYLGDVIEFIRKDGDGYDTTPDFRHAPILGDIVHSSPQYVGSNANSSYPDSIETAAYSDFVKSLTRTPMVYVGANDGMLHAFKAVDGKEVFSYIPEGVFSTEEEEGLHWLTDTSYTHMPYVDASPSVADVFQGGSWKTYLAGGLGRGGKSIYVLDITKDSNFSSASNLVVQEFTDTHLGYTFSRPQFAKLEDGEWALIFGNGYNNSEDGQAYLYVVYLDGSGPGGDAFVKLQLGSSGSVNGQCETVGSDCNGLSSPTLLDLDNNGAVDRVYAGDLHGNLWVVNFDSPDKSKVVPTIAHKNLAGNGVPLFTACRGAKPTSGFCDAADRQPITTKPLVVAHGSKRSSTTQPNLFVVFGTGRYLAQSDLVDTDAQSFYGVWDAGADFGALRSSDLTEQTITTSNALRSFSENSVDYKADPTGFATDTNYGWYMNLPVSGERVVVTPIIVDEVLIFSSTIPTTDICDGGGSGYLMGVELFSGGKTPFHVFPDKSADGILIDATGGLAATGDIVTLPRLKDNADGIVPAEAIDSGSKRAPRRTSWSIIK